MTAIFNSKTECLNWTFGKAYDASPSFVQGFVIIIDDDGAEQLIRVGSTLFKWEEKK